MLNTSRAMMGSTHLSDDLAVWDAGTPGNNAENIGRWAEMHG